MLTKETMQQIIEEENYRQEVRKSLDVPSSPNQRSRVMEFLNSTFFLALLSTFLVPLFINYYQSNSQKLKEKEVLERKISNERSEIKNRIDVIMRIDTAGIAGYEYVEIINALKGSIDSTIGFGLREEYAKRNIFSLIDDYKYDLKLEGLKGNESIIIRLPAIKDALYEAYNYLKDLYPYIYVTKEEGYIKQIDKKEAMKNPSKIDRFSNTDETAKEKFSEVRTTIEEFQ